MDPEPLGTRKIDFEVNATATVKATIQRLSLKNNNIAIDNVHFVQRAAEVPEPSTFLLLGGSLAGLASWGRLCSLRALAHEGEV